MGILLQYVNIYYYNLNQLPIGPKTNFLSIKVIYNYLMRRYLLKVLLALNKQSIQPMGFQGWQRNFGPRPEALTSQSRLLLGTAA